MSMRSDLAYYAGAFADGHKPVTVSVDVQLTPDAVILRGDGWARPLAWAYRDLIASVPLKSDARDLLLRAKTNETQTLFIADPGIAAVLLQRAPHLSAARTRLRWARPGIAAVLAVAAVVGSVFALGLSPAQGIARALPKPTREAMGRGVVTSIAGQYRTCETPQARVALSRLTERLTRAATPESLSVRVTVVDWSLVNAFATPGGQIILTRGLLQAAGSADEVAGVLAHELGHALELHPETGLVRAIGLSAAAQLVFAGSSGTMTNIGLLITQIQYTRIAELEADAHAVRMLKAAGISAKGLADFFQRIQSPSEGSVFNSSIIRTHPLTSERIAFVRAQPEYPATPALNPQEWQALRSACGPVPSAPQPRPNADANERTVAEASKALEVKPDDVDQLTRRARAYNALAKHDLALADWTKLVELRSTDANVQVSRGTTLDALRRYEEALQAYDSAMRLAPGHAGARNRHGLTNRILRRYEAALADFDLLIAQSPRYVAAHYNKGLVLLDLKRSGDALEAFASAIALDKDYAAAYTQRGLIHATAARKDEAIAEFRAALTAQGKQESTGWAHRTARENLAKLGATP